MSYKPNEFFVGVIDIFAILLPGSLLAFALRDEAIQQLFGVALPAIQNEVEGWIVFLFSAYLLGHFIFLIGSFIDKTLYDPYRKRFLTNDEDKLYQYARSIQMQQLANAEIINTYKWAKAKIELQSANASGEISRLEADSKFFRSLIIVLPILAILLLVTERSWIVAAACLLLTLLAFVRYADQRYKSTERAYTYFVAMNRPERQHKCKETEVTTVE